MSYGVVPPNTNLIDGSAVLRNTLASSGERSKSPARDDEESQALIQTGTRGHVLKARSSTFGVEAALTAPVQNIESLNYQVVENAVYRADLASRTHLDPIYFSGAKWMVAFVLGVTTAFAAFAVNLSVENISGFKFWVTLNLLEGGNYLGSYLTYVTINGVLVLGAVALTAYVGPAAAGSGIAEVKAYLNGIDVPGVFLFRTLVAKIFGSTLSVAGGLAIGKEGPFVHAGACIGALLSQGGSPTLHIPWFKKFWNDRDRADMVACGTAAGVAAAFRSPVGGVLFALEEMTSWWKNHLLWLAFFTTAVVSVAVRVMMSACKDRTRCGFFGSGDFVVYKIQRGQENYELNELVPVLLLGVVGGLLGSTFNLMNAMLVRWRKRKLQQYGVRGKVLEGLLISLVTSTLSFVLPLMFACQPCPEGTANRCPRGNSAMSGNFIHFGCARENHYNDLATIFFNTQDDAIRNLFSTNTKAEYSVGTLLVFVTFFYALAVVTYGMSVPVGLFVPSILCGAAYGRLVGIFVADMHPQHNIDEGTYALLGAASFLGGCMRTTVSTCVMLLELTNNLELLPLVMVVLLVAKAVGDGTGIGAIYELQMRVKGLPYLPPEPDILMRHVTAKEVCGTPPVVFQRVERVRAILCALQSCPHNGFPVLQHNTHGETSILGVVLRSHLLVLLNCKRSFQPSPFINESSGHLAMSYRPTDFVQPLSTSGITLEDIKLSEDQKDLYLDLGPYVNSSYYVVQEDMSLTRVYSLFRTLGVRHLCVIPRAHDVVGMITRENLLLDRVEERLREERVWPTREAEEHGVENGGASLLHSKATASQHKQSSGRSLTVFPNSFSYQRVPHVR